MSELANGERKPPREFHIDSERAANWLLRRLANIEAEKTRITAQCAAILADMERQRLALEDRYRGEMETWARAQVDGKPTKTLRLLQGTIQFRHVPGGLRITDKEAAINHAFGDGGVPDAVHYRPEIDAATYTNYARQALEETGELWPGVTLREAEERCYLRLSAGNNGGESCDSALANESYDFEQSEE